MAHYDGNLVVEVPLDFQYLSPEGMYMAGYLWGSHVRQVNDPDVIDTDNEDFIQGVSDGYGDKVREMELALAMNRKEKPKKLNPKWNSEKAIKLTNEDRSRWPNYEFRRKLEPATRCIECGELRTYSTHTCVPKKKWYQRNRQPNPFWD